MYAKNSLCQLFEIAHFSRRTYYLKRRKKALQVIAGRFLGRTSSLVFRSPRPLRYAKAFVFWVKTALQVVVGLVTCERTILNMDDNCEKMSFFATIFPQG